MAEPARAVCRNDDKEDGDYNEKCKTICCPRANEIVMT